MKKTQVYFLIAALGLLAPGRITSAAQAPRSTPLPSISAGIRSPVRVAAAPNGRIFVSEPAQGLVVVLDSAGRVLETHSGLGYPLALALDPAGHLLVSDSRQGSVTVYDSEFRSISTLGRGQREFG